MKVKQKIPTQFDGFLPIHLACKYGFLEYLQLLCRNLTLINVKTAAKDIPLYIAAESFLSCAKFRKIFQLIAPQKNLERIIYFDEIQNLITVFRLSQVLEVRAFQFIGKLVPS